MMEPIDNLPTLIYEHENWMAFNKPSRWHSVRPGRQTSSVNDHEPNMEEYLKSQFPSLRNLPECGMVHRLDYLTSGCLLVARNEWQQKRLQLLFRKLNQSVRKTYLAVVPRGFTPAHGEFEFYFSSRYRRSKRITVREEGSERERGVCRWSVVNNIQEIKTADCPLDMLRISIVGPGKRHQIRAGLSYLGYPIHGDYMYGGLYPWQGGFGLHACALQVDDIEVNAPPPDSWIVKTQK